MEKKKSNETMTDLPAAFDPAVSMEVSEPHTEKTAGSVKRSRGL